jgi:CHAT domain-containing protein
VLVLANRTHPDNPRPALGLVQAAQIVGTLFGVEPLLNTDATEDALRNRVPDSRIVHIGAHGIFNTVAPLESALLLAPQGNDDGRLTTGEVYGLDLKQADLVVLSGCETLTDQRANPNAPSSVTAGDELVGLTRAFFYAGTPTVIATLWQVDDTASQALLERFYTHLRAGVSKAEALRLAQQELKAEGRPVTEWAGFVLVGDGGKIGSPTTAQPWGLWAGVGAVLLVVARGAYWWRRRQEPVTQESSYTAEPLPTPSVEHSASD